MIYIYQLEAGPGRAFGDIGRQTRIPPCLEKACQVGRRRGRLGRGRAADRNNSPPNPSVPPQARPSSDPKPFPPSAKTLGFLPTLAAATLNCRRCQRRLLLQPKSAAADRLLLSAFQSLAIIGLLCCRSKILLQTPFSLQL